VTYRPLSFKKVKSCLVASDVSFNNLSESFYQKLSLQSLFITFPPTIGMGVLAKYNVLEVRSSFLLLGTGQKYTKLQPTFTTSFLRTLELAHKNLLFGGSLVTFFNFRVLSILYSSCYFKLNSNLFCLEEVYRPFLFCKQELFFFYSRPFYLFLSFFQKKVNFIQFNALLKSVYAANLL
jgi:hypothetical protein